MTVDGGWPSRPLPPPSNNEAKGCLIAFTALSFWFCIGLPVFLILMLLCCGVLA